MELAAQRVSIEQSLIRTYELGLPLSVEAVADLRAGLPRSDRFTDAKLAVLDGLATMHDEPEIALRAFERAAEISSALDASDLESVAHVGIAATNRRLGDLAAAGTATRRFIENAERLRVSVQDPHVASDMAAIAEEPYRFGLRIAVESGDALLALRVVERMRTERLASLFAARTRHSPRPDLEEVIDRLATLDREDAGQRRGELLAELASLTNKYFAKFYAPTTLAIDELVSELPAGDFVLAQDLAGVEGSSPELISIWRAPGSDWQVERRALSAAATDIVRSLASGRGSERDFVLDDVAQLADLVPTGLGKAIIDGGSGRLRIVPSGVLWTVPYLVVPVSAASSRLLVEIVDVSLLPSLRLLAAARRRHPRRAEGPVLSWLSPELDSQRGELAPFDDHGLIEAVTPPEFMDILTRPHDISMAIITSHCNDAPGLAQSATLGGRPVLTAADLLAVGGIPPIVSIAGCHGLNASGAGDEQLGLTTAAICGGADDVVSSHVELATSAITTVALLRVYRRLITGARADAAVSSVVRELLQRADRTKTPLALWGALNVVSVRS